MKHFDNNELNPNKIIRLLNNRVVVDSNGYNSEKNRYFYRYIAYNEYSQNLFLTNSMNNTKTRKYNISTFIKKSFLYEYSKKRKKNESLYKFKKRFLLEMEELLITSPAITIQAKEKISYIFKNFFFANISSN